MVIKSDVTEIYYLWVHDKDHWTTSVDVCGYKFVFSRVSVTEVNLYELPVAVSTIKDTPVHPMRLINDLDVT